MRNRVEACVAVEYARLGLLNQAVSGAAAPTRRAVAEYLGKSGRPADGLLILTDLGQERDAKAELAIIDSLIDQGEQEEAQRVARSISHPGKRGLALARVATARNRNGGAADAHRLVDEALGLLPQLGQFDVDSIEAIATALADTGQVGSLIKVIHREWLHAADPEELAIWLGLLSPLVRTRSELAAEVADSFQWIDQFLASLSTPEATKEILSELKLRRLESNR